MKTQNKVVLGFLAVVGLLIPQFTFAQQAPVAGIAPYHMSNYLHAKKVLKEQYPDFLTQFNQLAQDISYLKDTDKAGQYDALMRFFPAIEKMVEIEPSISTDVVVSFFAMQLETANDTATNVDALIFDAFKVFLANGDATGILSEEALMEKHGFGPAQAQKIRTVLHKLYPTSTLL